MLRIITEIKLKILFKNIIETFQKHTSYFYVQMVTFKHILIVNKVIIDSG